MAYASAELEGKEKAGEALIHLKDNLEIAKRPYEENGQHTFRNRYS